MFENYEIAIYYAYLDSWAIVGTASYALSTAITHLTFLCSIQNNNNTLVSACWKYASTNANSPLGYNIAYFRNSHGIDIFPNVCVKKVIHPPRLDNEQHMIISELNMLLLAKKAKCITSIVLLSQILTTSLN